MAHQTEEVELVDVRGGALLGEVRSLMMAYVRWMEAQPGGADAEWVRARREEVRSLPGEYAPPLGDLVAVLVNGQMAGCVALRRHSADAAEVKRLFVSPGYRGQSLGLRLVGEMVTRAQRLGYRRLLLDTLPIMTSAQRMYRQMGFVETSPYYEGALPGSRFFELILDTPPDTPRMVTWEPAFRDDFERLNRQWLEEYFVVEPRDVEVFQDPQGTIRDLGGEIFFVEENGRLNGTCAVVPHADGSMELAKMAVAPEARGRGFGEWLVRAAIQYAQAHGARRVILLSDEKLRDALRLYERIGFVRQPFPGRTGYARGDVFMEYIDPFAGTKTGV